MQLSRTQKFISVDFAQYLKFDLVPAQLHNNAGIKGYILQKV